MAAEYRTEPEIASNSCWHLLDCVNTVHLWTRCPFGLQWLSVSELFPSVHTYFVFSPVHGLGSILKGGCWFSCTEHAPNSPQDPVWVAVAIFPLGSAPLILTEYSIFLQQYRTLMGNCLSRWHIFVHQFSAAETNLSLSKWVDLCKDSGVLPDTDK